MTFQTSSNMSRIRCRWCGAYAANIVDLQMHSLDCQPVNNDPDSVVVTSVINPVEEENGVENTQELNILLEALDREPSVSDTISHSSVTSVSSDDFETTVGDEDIEELIEEEDCENDEGKVKEQDMEEEKETTAGNDCVDDNKKVQEQEKDEENKTTLDYVDVLRHLEIKEKDDIEKVVEGARKRINEVEGRMARYHEEMKTVNDEFEAEKQKMIKIVKEKHREVEVKNETITMMEEVINGMIKDLDKSNSLLEKKNSQLQKIGTELQAQKHDLDRQMDEQKTTQEELKKAEEKIFISRENIQELEQELATVKHEQMKEKDRKVYALEKEMKEKEEKIKLLEKNLSQVQDEKTRLKNEKKVMKGKEGEEEISIKKFHEDFQEFRRHVLAQFKQQEKRKESDCNNNGKRKEKAEEKECEISIPAVNPHAPLMEEIAPWDSHSNGFASKYMKKKGHQLGQGLGKSGDGIIQPISAEKRTFVADESSDSSRWPRDTILIAGDSMIGGIHEKMSKTYNVKVRSHPGATTRDMRDHLNALLRKKPSHLILHAGTNDAVDINTSADDIYDRLIDLKILAESSVPGIKVSLSPPTVRFDDGLANAKLLQVRNRLKRSGVCILDNDNIAFSDISKFGLHLKPSGTKKLAANMIAYMRSL